LSHVAHAHDPAHAAHGLGRRRWRHRCTARPQLILVACAKGASTTSRIAWLVAMSRTLTRCSHQLRALVAYIGPAGRRAASEKKCGQNRSRLAEA
jgi:hypothetical protein